MFHVDTKGEQFLVQRTIVGLYRRTYVMELPMNTQYIKCLSKGDYVNLF